MEGENDMTEKIERDTFLYFNHHENSDKNEFAQCSTCRMFVPDENMDDKSDYDLCILHGSKQKVGETYSCGLYAIWPKGKPNPIVVNDHAEELKKGIPGSVTAKESGLVNRKVRCENCFYFDKNSSKCKLYLKLNNNFPSIFNLDVNVEKYGCCNANTAKQ
jgi:hypothetical protein